MDNFHIKLIERPLKATLLIFSILISLLGNISSVNASSSFNITDLKQTVQGSLLAEDRVYNDTDIIWVYSGGWVESQVGKAFQGQIHTSNKTGDLATISFSGNSFTLIYTKSAEYGKLVLYVDDKKIDTINQRGSKTSYQKEWKSPLLSQGNHTLKLMNESGDMINIDAIKIHIAEPNPVPTNVPKNTETPTSTNTPVPTNTIPAELPTVTSSPFPPTATIVPSQTPLPFVSPTSLSIPSQSPYNGTAKTIPGIIQAEDFDNGGEGIAYHDTTSSNEGSQYRTSEALDIETTTDTGGGYNIGYIKVGEWSEYTVNVTTSGLYFLNLRLANTASGGVMHVEVDGVNVTGSITIPNTGGWQIWQTVTVNGISLSAGQHIVKLAFDIETPAGLVGNINYFAFAPSIPNGPTLTPSIPLINTNTPIFSPTASVVPSQLPPLNSASLLIPSQSPYNGTAKTIPGIIQAEDFDNGGEGVAYHDTTSSNEGSQYRTNEAVDIQTTIDSGGGYNIGWVKAGEWYEYTVNVTTTGSYSLNLRLANTATGGSLHVEVDGVNVTGPISVPNTGGFQTWQTVTKNGIALSTGQHVIRLSLDNAATNGYTGNINSMAFSLSGSAQIPSQTPTALYIPTATSLIPSQSPYNGTAKTIPGIIQAEDFDNGGEGVAYHDTTSSNEGSQYRTNEAVDIQTTIDSGGGYNIGWVKAGEWYEYTVNVTTTGSYSLNLRLANTATGGSLHVEVDGVNVTGPISVPNTGGFQTWQTVTKNGIALSTGQHVIRLSLDNAATNGYTGNINSMAFSLSGSAQIPSATLISSPTATIVPSQTPLPFVSPTSLSIPSQSPYNGTAKTIPGIIQAEDFDNGGEGIAYHDTTSSNEGSQYRTSEALDIETTTDTGGGYNIGYIKVGEWSEYTVNVTTSGLYFLNLRLANTASGGVMHVEVDGVNVTGSITIPNTGGWQIWQTVTVNGISLSAGQHIVKLAFDIETPAGLVGNINYFAFAPSISAQTPLATLISSPTATIVPSQTPTATVTATSVPTGSTYYVSPNGNDNNPGIQALPWRTIQKAANSAPSGSVINVLAGNYPERVHVRRSNLTFEAIGEVITRGWTIYDSEQYLISNVTVRGFKVVGASGAGFDIFGSKILIENNEIYGNLNDGSDSDGIDFFCNDCIIRGNYIHDLANSGHPDCFQTWADSWHPPAYNVTIENNTCHNMQIYTNDSTGRGQGIIISSGPGTNRLGSVPHDITLRNNLFYAYKGVAIHPAISSPPYNISIVNNTFLGVIPRPNSSYSIQGIVCDGGNVGTVTVKNNIAYNIDQLLIGTCYVDDYNLLYRDSGSITGIKRLHDIWAVNPLFVNPTGTKTFANFAPKSGSPACTGGENGTYIGASACK